MKDSLTLQQLYTVATVIASRSPNVATLIAMRAIMAMGSSAVTSVGTGTLADLFESHERGRKVGDCSELFVVATNELNDVT